MHLRERVGYEVLAFGHKLVDHQQRQAAARHRHFPLFLFCCCCRCLLMCFTRYQPYMILACLKPPHAPFFLGDNNQVAKHNLRAGSEDVARMRIKG